MKLKAFIKKDMLLFIKRNKDTLMLFVLKKNNTPIGYINIDLDESHDLGYGLKKEYWHQEIVSEAVNPLFNKLKKKSLII